MADLLYLVTLVAFFALMVAFVRLCERIVGKDGALGSDRSVAAAPDDAPAIPTAGGTTPEEVPA